jgi:SAM-dependent methyltransferase
MKCHACGVVFLEPLPSPAYVSEHFTDRYIPNEERLQRTFGEARDSVLSVVAAHVQEKRKEGGRILDVGCAGGHFLSRFFASSSWQSFGVEPSRYAAARAAEKGIKVYQGSVLSVELPAAFFDVVTVVDVLYYFREPLQELRAIRSALKPDGLLFIALPLAATQLWRHTYHMGRLLGGTTRSLLNSGHFYLFNPSSLEFLLREAGFGAVQFHPLPGIRQRRPFEEILSRTYYQASRLLWHVSGGHLMMGPNFLVTALLG